MAEPLGGWHESAVEQIKKLSSALARHTGQEESDKIRHLYQGLAVPLVKGNASLFLNRTPAFPTPEIDGETITNPSLTIIFTSTFPFLFTRKK